MTRAQKTELAYYQIMHATQYAQGNMARTLLTPASALRVVQTEFKQLGRAMGSIFIPMVMKVIPYVRALTQILTDLAKRIAAFFGFKISDYEFTAAPIQDIGAAFGDVEDNVNGATKALKKMLMPFDELNNVNFDTGSGSGGGIGGVGGGGSLGLDTYDYDMFAGASDEINKKVQEIKDNFKKMLPIIVTIGAILATMWGIDKIATFVLWIKKVADALAFLAPIAGVLKIIGGVISTVAGVILYIKGIFDILNPQLSYTKGLIEAIGGAILVVVGLLLLPVSTTVAIVAGIVAAVGILGATIWRFRDELAKFFTKTIPGWFNSALKWVGELPKKIGYWLGYALGKVVKFIADIPKAVQSFFTQTLPKWGEAIAEFFTKTIPEKWSRFINWLKTLPQKMLEIGITIIQGLVNGIIGAHNWARERVFDFVNGFVQGFKDALGIKSSLSQVFANIGIMVIQGLINGVRSLLGNVMQTFETMRNNIVSKFETIKNNASQKIENMKNSIAYKFDNMRNIISDKIWNISNNISNVFSNIKNSIVNKINEAKDGVRYAIDRMKGYFHFNWSLPHLRIPHLSWTTKRATGWVADILSALNLPTSLPKLNIEWYAGGGFPKEGQIFGANENGPELIGNIGRRTAVANQQQITEGISDATYSAFSRALSENRNNSEGNPHIVVNIGDDKVYDGIARKENQYSNMYGVRL